MITKETTPVGYTYKLNPVVRVSPLRGLTLGWRDCQDSLAWWGRYAHPASNIRNKELARRTFFEFLGQPLERTSSYNAPWDDYLQFPGDAIWVGGVE